MLWFCLARHVTHAGFRMNLCLYVLVVMLVTNIDWYADWCLWYHFQLVNIVFVVCYELICFDVFNNYDSLGACSLLGLDVAVLCFCLACVCCVFVLRAISRVQVNIELMCVCDDGDEY